MGVNFGVKSVKYMYFRKKILLFSQALIRQVNYIKIMSNIVNFVNPMTGLGYFESGRGHI